MAITSHFIMAQLPIDTKKFSTQQIKKFGESSVRIGDIYSAIDFYVYYTNKKEKDFEALYNLGHLYRQARDYKNALSCYKKVVENENQKFPEAAYYYALMLMQTGKYDMAAIAFENFRKSYKNTEDKYFKKMAVLNYEACKNVKWLMEPEADITLTPMGSKVNHAHIDFSPIPFDENTIVYGALETDSIEYFTQDDTLLKTPRRKLLQAKKKQNIWEKQGEFAGPFNSGDAHSGHISFSNDRKRAYYTQCAKNWQGKMICNLYMSKFENGKWQVATLLPYNVNNANYTSTMPAVGSDPKEEGDIIYFVSDREGTRGNMDIWYTKYNIRKNRFDNAKNAGSKLNTIADELYPWYDFENRSLYFSSDGYQGFGGFDMYQTTGELKNWSPPKNLGVPFNTHFDDVAFSIGTKKSDGYIASNRDGSLSLKNEHCCDDIFYFQYNEFIYVGVRGQVIDKAENTILSYLNRKFNLGLELKTAATPLAGVGVDLYYIDMPSQTEYKIKNEATQSDGSFFFDLEVNKNYMLKVNAYDTTHVIKFNTQQVTFSDTLDLPPLGVNYIPERPLAFSVYFGFGEYELNQQSMQVLDTTLVEVLNTIPDIVVEISTHTDSIGNDSSNMVLSQKRAESIVNYMIQQGIKQDRLIAVGYGATMPIAPNSNPDGSDNEIGREMNRRAEIKILGTLKQINAINKKESDEEDIE